MKNAKHWLSVLLSVAVVLTMAITPAMATGTDDSSAATITVETVTKAVTAGEEVTLNVSLADNPGFAGLDFTVVYDQNKLELKDVVKGALLSNGFFTPNAKQNKVVFANTELLSGDGALFTLKFIAKADSDNAKVDIENKGFTGIQNESFQVNIIPGGVNVPGSTTGGSTTGGSTTGGSTTGGSTTGGSTTGGSTTGGSTTGGSTTGGSTTGVLYSEAGSSYIGACSKYAKYGWVNGLDPTSYVGMQITYNRSDDSDADFNTTRVGVSGKLNVHNLDVWGEKSRVVPTSFGALKMAAFETPVPTFADWGKGQCGPEGWCLIALDPRYAETIAQYGQPAWLLTDCDGTGHLWAENCGQYAIIHGAPGQCFAWLCMAAQRGYEGSYADRSDSSYPAGDPAGIELAASTAARAQDESTTAADDLLAMDTGANETADILLDESEELA